MTADWPTSRSTALLEKSFLGDPSPGSWGDRCVWTPAPLLLLISLLCCTTSSHVHSRDAVLPAQPSGSRDRLRGATSLSFAAPARAGLKDLGVRRRSGAYQTTSPSSFVVRHGKALAQGIGISNKGEANDGCGISFPNPASVSSGICEGIISCCACPRGVDDSCEAAALLR